LKVRLLQAQQSPANIDAAAEAAKQSNAQTHFTKRKKRSQDEAAGEIKVYDKEM